MSSHVHRLISLINTLSSDQQGVDIARLALMHRVSDKTVRRDLLWLKRLGCQILESSGEHGRKRYQLITAPQLTMNVNFDEALALFFGCHTSLAYRETNLGRAAESSLSKLRAALGPLEANYVERHLPKFCRLQVVGDYARYGEVMDPLQLAMEDRLVVQVTYQSAARRKPVRYPMHPYGIVEHRGALYVVGYSAWRQAIRTWKLDRVSRVELTDEKFKVPADFDLRDYFKDAFAIIGGTKLQRIVIRFKASAARYVREKQFHSSQRCRLHRDGSATVEFRLSSTLEIKSWILSFGQQAEVIRPVELRQEIAAEVQQLAQLYASAPMDPVAAGPGNCPRDARSSKPR